MHHRARQNQCLLFEFLRLTEPLTISRPSLAQLVQILHCIVIKLFAQLCPPPPLRFSVPSIGHGPRPGGHDSLLRCDASQDSDMAQRESPAPEAEGWGTLPCAPGPERSRKA